MDRSTQRRRATTEARAQEEPGIDPALGLLVAATSVLLALAFGTGLFLLLPAAV